VQVGYAQRNLDGDVPSFLIVWEIGEKLKPIWGVLMRIVSVVGARPQFVKLAAMHRVLSKSVNHSVIHTGQHYDPMLSESFFNSLEIPHPEVNLSVGSGSHASQTASIITALERELERLDPTWLVVYGDTNSTIAASLVGAKMGLRVAHLEAGLRSFNRAMPEEVNRVLTDHASDLCLAPSATAMDNLEREGLLDRSVMVGDVMVDVLYATLNKLEISLDKSERPIGQYLVATIHRQENTDEEQILGAVFAALDTMPLPVRLFTHPRLRERIGRYSINTLDYPNVEFLDPIAYPALIREVANAAGVLTDSGGLQKEAFLLRTPCVTLRAETEWPETIELGWNRLAHSKSEGIADFLRGNQERNYDANPYGNGTAAHLAVEAILAAT